MKSNDFVVKGYSRVRKFLFPVHYCPKKFSHRVN